tara:strand:+ start:467 stop:571 length:105 start_codon:yes stop_codon:yes gene_type:complete
MIDYFSKLNIKKNREIEENLIIAIITTNADCIKK